MLHYVHSSLVYNSQKLETTQISFKGRMDTEHVEYYTMDISPKVQNTQDTIHKPHEAQEKGRQKCGYIDPS